MRVALLATALIDELSQHPISFQPPMDVRKATPLMKSALATAQLCLERAAPPKDASMSLVVGSSLGEIEVTKDFLIHFSREGISRPFLFQNSLHNSICGFLTMVLNIKGPSITVSHRFTTAECALNTAKLMLDARHPYALVICGEVMVKEFLPGYSRIYPKDLKLKSGTAAAVLTTEEEVTRLNHSPLAWINKISFEKGVEGAPMSEYYDSDGLEKIILALGKNSTEASGSPLRRIVLPKPDFLRSIIEI